MKYLFLILSFFVFKFSFSATQGFERETLCAVNGDSTAGSVRKSVFKIKGKAVERQVYFNYLKCKHCRSQLISSSVFIGIGAIALAGSIPFLLRANGFSGNGIYYGSGGIVLGSLGVFGLSVGIPFTIKSLKEYKTKYKGNCNEQTIYLSPGLTGFALAYRF